MHHSSVFYVYRREYEPVPLQAVHSSCYRQYRRDDMPLMQTALVVAMLQHRMHPDEGQLSVEFAPSFANVYM